MRRNRGFTLIELMVAMVVGLTAITSVYSLGAAMSKQFYEEQRLATSQGTSRVAIMELRHSERHGHSADGGASGAFDQFLLPDRFAHLLSQSSGTLHIGAR